MNDRIDRTQRPVFVYGTLRHGQGNYRHILDGVTVSEQRALLPDHAIYGSGVPFAMSRPGHHVVGEVMEVAPEAWEITLARLDRLEGHTGHPADDFYVRRVRPVRCGDQVIEAYVYLAGHRAQAWCVEGEEIPGGDFLGDLDAA